VQRNGRGALYVDSIAHGPAKQRRRAASSRAHLPEAVQRELIARLHQQHSPEEVGGRLSLLKDGQVSHTTVYRYARQFGLRHLLRLPKRRRRYGHNPSRRFTDRRSIHERPADVALRTSLSDWEADTMRAARGSGVLVTMVERRTESSRAVPPEGGENWPLRPSKGPLRRSKTGFPPPNGRLASHQQSSRLGQGSRRPLKLLGRVRKLPGHRRLLIFRKTAKKQ